MYSRSTRPLAAESRQSAEGASLLSESAARLGTSSRKPPSRPVSRNPVSLAPDGHYAKSRQPAPRHDLANQQERAHAQGKARTRRLTGKLGVGGSSGCGGAPCRSDAAREGASPRP